MTLRRKLLQSAAAVTIAAAGFAASPVLAADVGACLITKTDTNPFFVKMKEGAKETAIRSSTCKVLASFL